MATLDPSIYLQTRPKSAFEYLQEMAAADDAKQTRQLRGLQLLAQQGQMQDAQQARDIRNRGMAAVQGLGGAATDDQRISALRGVGDYSTADAIEKSMLERQKTGATIKKDQAETDAKMFETGRKQIDLILQAVSSAKDQPSYVRAVQFLASQGVDVSQVPQQYDPNAVAQFGQMALTAKERIDNYFEQVRLAETGRHNRAQEGLTARGQNLTDARAREANDINKQAGRSQVVETPDGVMIVDKGTGLSRPAATIDGKTLAGKLPESARKQATGIDALSSAIGDYREALKRWGKLDIVSPDARAEMGTKYNNMMLQAKEAYNLGVLNGPDYQILTSVITDPSTLKGAITSNKAMDSQAAELDRMMKKTRAAVTGKQPAKAVTRTGRDASGRRVVQYDDGSIEYAD